MNKRQLLQPTTVTIYIAATLYALLIIIPIYFVFVSAFKENPEIFRTPLAPPQSLDFSKFEVAQGRVDMVSAIGNSICFIYFHIN